jgi:hypothetical protein
MDEDEVLARYGLTPTGSDLAEVRTLLVALTEQGPEADTTVMKLCCVQLFNNGSLDDVLAIWRAKECSWDAHASIDVQLLCGAGLDETKAYLSERLDGHEALEYLFSCEAAGDFEHFSVKDRADWYAEYYS